MASDHSFTINLHPQPEGGFTVLVPALPEVVTEGETRAEALANAREAIEAIISLYVEDGRPIPDDVATEIEHLTVAA